MKLRVWWIPQMGMDAPAFKVKVDNVREGVKIMNALAYYDLYQLKHKIKPDYSNTGGLQMFDETANEWCDWEDLEAGEDDPEQWLEDYGDTV